MTEGDEPASFSVGDEPIKCLRCGKAEFLERRFGADACGYHVLECIYCFHAEMFSVLPESLKSSGMES